LAHVPLVVGTHGSAVGFLKASTDWEPIPDPAQDGSRIPTPRFRPAIGIQKNSWLIFAHESLFYSEVSYRNSLQKMNFRE
jgi:hypothetical protein